MARTIIVVERKDGIVVALIKFSFKVAYYIYVFPFVFLFRVIAARKAAQQQALAPPQLQPQATQPQIIHVEIAAPALELALPPQPRRIICEYCKSNYLEEATKCPECGAKAPLLPPAPRPQLQPSIVSVHIPAAPSTSQQSGTSSTAEARGEAFGRNAVMFAAKHPKATLIGIGCVVVLGIIGSADKKSKAGVANQSSTQPANVTDGPEDVAQALSSASDRDELWDAKYSGKFVHWEGSYERSGVLVEFIASTGAHTAMSCEGYGSAHDPSKFKSVEKDQRVAVDGRLTKQQKQMGKDKTEFILTDCVATTIALPQAAAAGPLPGSSDAQVLAVAAGRTWSSFPKPDDKLWSLAGPAPGDDEFERKANTQKRAALATEVRATNFYLRATAAELGDYNFKKSAFPIYYTTVTNSGILDDHVDWKICVCSPRSEPDVDSDGVRLVNDSHEWTVYRWGEKRQVLWVPVPEATAKDFAEEHRDHIDVDMIVRVAGVTTDKNHYFNGSAYRENAETGGLIYFKEVGPIRITGRHGAVLLDTLPKFPAIK